MMTMAQCWEQLSEPVRRKIVARHPGVTEQQLPKRIVQESYWQTYQHVLSENERIICNWFALQRGDEGLTLHQLQRAELPLPLVLFRLALTHLHQRGVVFSGRLPWGETVYVVPSDVRAAWLRVALPCDGTTRDESIELTRQAPYGVLHDLFHLLVMMDHMEVKLTGHGTIHQRIQQKMNVELETPAETFQGADWLIGKEDDVTAFHIVFHLAERAQLIRKVSKQKIEVAQKYLCSWLNQSHQEATSALYREVKRAFLSTYPRDAAIVWWMEQQSGWVDVREMAMFWMQQLARPVRRWPSFADNWTKKWLEPLYGLGWIDWGESRFGTVWRWSANAPFTAVKKAPVLESYVQPDFEWLLPLQFPLQQRWQAAQFADLLQIDQLCTYDINANSVKRGVMKGWTANGICQFLQEHSVTPLPQNVEVSIRQWAEQSGNVVFERVVLMSCQDEQLAEKVYNHQDLKPLWKKRMNETQFIVEEKDLQPLFSRLEKEGYTCVTVGEVPSLEAISEAAYEQSRAALRIEDRYPTLEEAVPSLATLPKMWTSGMREYHRSTMLKLVKRALDMQLALEWNNRTDKEGELLWPTRLTKVDGEWMVTGVDNENGEREIQLSEVRQVKIKLPDTL